MTEALTADSVLETITGAERLFAEGLVAGMSGVEAAEHSGGCRTKTPSALSHFASRLRARPVIQQAIREMREQFCIDSESLWEEAKRVVGEVLKDKSNRHAQMKAFEYLAKMRGALGPEQHQHQHVHAHVDVRAPVPVTPEERQEAAEDAERNVAIYLRSLPSDRRDAVLRCAGVTPRAE